MNSKVLAGFIGLVFCSQQGSFGATLIWTNLSGGSWSDAANWSPNQVPASADAVVVTNAGSYTVTVPVTTTIGGLTLGASAGSQSIEQTGGIFTLNGETRILSSGSLTWISGNANGPITISPNGSLQLNGATKNVHAPLTNRGTIRLSGTGDLYLHGNNGARVENEGLFDFLADRDVYGINGNPPFRNTGSIRKSAGTGTARLGVANSYPVLVENLGLIESQAGVLQLFGGGTLAGQLVTATGARVDLVGGTWTQPTPAVPVVSGAGSSRLTGGTLRLLNSIPNLQLTGGTVVLLPSFQDGGSITNLVLEGSTLDGTNIVTGTLRWRDGTIGGVLTIQPNAVLIAEGSAIKTCNAAITNRGTFQFTGTGDLYMYGNNGARLVNEGLFEFLADRDVYGINGNPPVRNTGTIRKSAGTGAARLGVVNSYPVLVDNFGLIESQAGVLQLFGGGTLAGQLVTGTGARVELAGGTWTQSTPAVPVVSGAGSSRLTGGTLRLLNSIPNLQLTGGTVVLLPSFQDGGSITNLVLEGSTLDGTNIVTGTLRWRDGTIGGVLTIQPNAVLIAEGSAIKTCNAAITNRGTFQFTGTGDLYMYGNNGARLVNEGLFEFLADRDVYGINGNPPFRNTGVVRKSAGSGAARLGVAGSYPVPLDNFGLIESQSGVLQLFGGGNLGGQLMASAGARVELVGGTWIQLAADVPVVSGAGSVRFTGGTLRLVNSIPNLQLTGGVVTLVPEFQNGGAITNLTLEGTTLSGTNVVTGTLRWRDGAISGFLTVESNAVLVAEGAAIKTWNAAITNRGTFQFTGTGDLYLYGNNGARLVNQGLFEFLADRDVFGINGNAPLSNTGVIRKSAGSGTARLGVAGSYPVALENVGLIESQAGVLQLFGGGVLDGSLRASTGARLELVGGTWTQLGADVPVISGAGSVRFTAGTLRLLNAIPNLQLTGGFVLPLPAFQAGGAITNLTLQGATLAGTNAVLGTLVCQAASGPLTVLAGGALGWTEGAFAGPVVIESNAVLTLMTTSVKTLNGALTNRGTIQFQSTGPLYLQGNNGARVDNDGLWDTQGDSDIFGIAGDPPFRNLGELRKSAGTGNARLGVSGSYPVSFENLGAVTVLSGVYQFFGGGLLTGHFSTVPGTRIEFVGGTWTQPVAGTAIFTGGGEARFTGGIIRLLDRIPNLRLTGGTAVLLPDFQDAGAIRNLVLEGTTLGGTNLVLGSLVCQSLTGPLTIAPGGAVNWTEGTFAGPVLVESNAVFTLSTPSIKTLNGALTNRGTVRHESSGPLYLYGNNGARVETSSLWEIQGEPDIFGINGTPAFRNTGLLHKTSGTGSARIGVSGSYPVAFENLGTVESVFGTLGFFGSSALPAGTLRVAVRSLTDYGRVNFANPVTLGGTLGAYLVGGYQPVVGNRFTVVSFNSASGLFTDEDLPDGIVWQTDYAAANVTLTVLGACTPAPDGLAAWWAAEGTADEAVANNDGTLRNGTLFASGRVGQAFSFDGLNDFVEVPDANRWAFGANDFSVGFWANLRNVPASTLANPAAVFIGQSEGTGNLGKWFFALGGGVLNVHLNGPGLGPRFLAQAAFSPVPNTWSHLAFTRSNGVYRVFTNGLLAASETDTTPIPNLVAPLTLGSAEGRGFVDGLLDEMIIVTRALSAGEVSAIHAAGSLGLCRPTQPPLIVNQPQSRTNAPGTIATFTVAASGSSPLGYQWQINGAPLSNGGRISGAQSALLSIASVQANDAGPYTVTVSNAAGSTNSLPAQLVVDGVGPVISQVSSNVTQTQCILSWQTDEPATSVVEYGLTENYGATNRFNGARRTLHTMTLSGLTPGLAYRFRIRSADAVSNETVTAGLTFNTLPAPDLSPSILSATSLIQVGQSFTVVFTITNSGAAAASSSWQNALLVANAPDGSGAQTVATATFNPGPGGLAVGASVTVTQTVLFPNLSTGPRHIGVRVDNANQVVEVSESNNTAYRTEPALVTATDLQVSRVTGPGSATFGQSIHVQFVVTNAGSGPAPFAWTDRLHLSSVSNSISGATLLATATSPVPSLPAGQSYTNSATVNLPLSAQSSPGPYFLVVSADPGNAITESAEGNNLGATPLALTLPPLPDLAPRAIVAPTQAQPGQTLAVSWVVTNQGTLMATGVWSETVYLATNTAGAGAFELGNFVYTNTIPVGGALPRAQSVVLPINSPLGSLWTIVRVDSGGDITEENEANNPGAAASPTVIPAVLTLQASAAQVAEGATQPVRFTVTRNGSRASALTVSVATPDATELLAPANVVIAAGQASATFDVSGRMDGIVDGPRVAPIQVSAPGFQSASVNVTVLDVDVPQLVLTLSTNTVLEGQIVSATIQRDSATASQPVIVTTVASNPSQLLAPIPVTIPGGATSVSIELLAVDDSLIENVGAYVVTVSAPGYASASTNVLVVDDDLPSLTFALAPPSFSEGAGPQATLATVTRNTVNSRTLELDLESNNTNAARVPPRVIIPGSAASVSFPVSAVDNDLVDGPRSVQLRVWIRATGLATRLAEGPPATLTVTDDDGPTLRLVIDRDVAGEGADPGAHLTVSRNTATNAALVVNLASSDTTELITPNTVTIPAGAISATSAMRTVDDGTTDGNQVVTVAGSAPGFTSGADQVTVTDINLPDLIVAGITAPATAETEAFISIGYQLRNQGVSLASSNAIGQRIYLSADPLVGDDVLIGQFTFNGGLPPDTQFGQAFSARMPQAPGDYWVIVDADVANTVPEIIEQNNTRISSAPIRVVTAYDAVVSTTLESAPAGTPVPFVGRAFHTNGVPAPFALVSIHIYVRDTHRIIAALADASGNFSTTWQPLPGEAGSYSAGAAHPGVLAAPGQDSFTLHGIKATPASLSLTIAEQSSVGGLIQLVNQSALPLTAVQAAVLSKPSNLDVTISLQTNVMAGGVTNFLSYGITALDASIGQGQVRLRVTSGEGAGIEVPITVRVEALRPRLVAAPQQLSTGVKRGGQRLVEFQVANIGGAPSGPISVSLPPIPWLSLISPNPLPSLAPGETNSVTLSLLPDDNQPLTVFNGNLALNAAGAGLSVPFQFRILSEARGDLKVTAVDEFTYYAAGAPRVSNATVVVRDTISRAVITNGVTDRLGELFVPQLMEGYYDLEVSADRHNSYRHTHLILSGTTNEVSTFISRQTVRYTWTVERIEIEDRYRITIETEFEANVPAPVVTIQPAVIDVADMMVVGQVKQVNMTIENHGLIAVDNTRLNFGTHPFYSIEPLIKDIGRLGAKASLTIPVTVRRIGTFASAGGGFQAASGGGGGAPCGMGGDLSYEFECGPLKISGGSGVGVSGVQGDCGGGGTSGGGGGPVTGTGSSSGGGGSSGGGSVNTGYSSLEIGVKIGCDPTCLVLAGLGCIPGPVGCFFSGVGCGKGLAEDGVQAIDVADCAIGAAGCLGPPPVAAAACAYALVRCFITPTGGGAGDLFLAAAAASDPLAAFKPGVRTMLDSFNELTGAPDGVWFNPQANTDMGLWLVRFQEAARPGSDGGRTVTPAERASLLVGVQPPGVALPEIIRFLERWNRSLQNWALGILRPADAAPGANLDFIDALKLKETLILAGEYHEQAVAAGFTDPINALVETVRFRAAAGEGGGTCARVRLKIDQQAVLSREAFRATLEFDNGDAASIEGIGVELRLSDVGGNDALTRFGIAPPVVTGLSDVNGGGALSAGAKGTAKWTIIPTVDAAPLAPTNYFVSGTLRYRLNGVAVTIPLAPHEITVHPVPRLTVQYFHERDVFSDDPHTDEIEPTIPFNLAVLVLNKGAGAAKNFRITSAQPEIIENEKGLLIDFKIIATEVAGQNLLPSLTANFGTINPGTNGIARWLMTSTLQGLFINYRATFEHIDGLGNPKLSLIDDVSIHEMNRLVQAGGAFEDRKPDFLVNDKPDLRDYPDTLYLSDGTTNAVEAVTNAVVTGTLSSGNLQIQISAAMPGGWAYLRVPDPGNGLYRLAAVRRSDNGLVAVPTNAWVTDRTFYGQGTRPVRENVLHLLDYNSTGSYTLTYQPNPAADTQAPTSVVAALSASSGAAIVLNWAGQDNAGGSGIAFYDVYVSENGAPFQRWLSGTASSAAVYQGELGRRYSFYSVAVDGAGNREDPPGSPDAQTTVTQVNRPPIPASLADVTITERDVLDLTVTATDPDGDALSFSLLPGAPVGMVLNGYTGQLTWTTGEGHGPSTNHVTVRVQDSGVPQSTVLVSFKVIVLDENEAPTLAPIEDRIVGEGQLLTVNSSAADADLPPQTLRYSLGPGAPAGASINPATGVFSWRPSNIQGGTTNAVTILVTDNGVPAREATQSFRVTVRDTRADFVVSVGSTNVLAGGSSAVPVMLASSLDLTNLSFLLEADARRLTNFLLTPLAPGIVSATLAPAGAGRSELRFVTGVGTPLLGDVLLGRVDFTTTTNATSAVVPIDVLSVTGVRGTGETVRNAGARSGQVVVIGNEIVLVALLDPQRRVAIYGRPGLCVTLQVSTNLSLPAWELVGQYRLSGQSEFVTLPPVNFGASFYRALLCDDRSPILVLRVEADRTGTLILSGQPGAHYVIQQKSSLRPAVAWGPLTNLTLGTANGLIPGLPLTNTARFFRALGP